MDTTRVATLSLPPGRLFLDGTAVARDGRGRFFTTADGRTQVAVFDSTGTFLTAFGRRGDGPGEFGEMGIAAILVGAADTLYVRDLAGRYNVFSPQFDFIRRFSQPPGVRATVPLSDGSLLFSAWLRSSDQVGYPWHVMNSEGTVVRSIGRESARGVGEGGVVTSAPRSGISATLGSSSFWAGGDYLLEHWSVRGDFLAGYQVVGVEWLPDPVYERQALFGPGRSGGAAMEAMVATNRGSASILGVDAEGLVWLRLESPARTAAGNPQPRQYRIEVFDPVSRTVLASFVRTNIWTFIHGHDLIATAHSDASDSVTYVIWRLRLRRA